MAEIKRLLLVEDMAEQGRPIVEAFEGSGSWQVHWAKSCAEARECLTAADVVLCDRNLPDGDGISLLKYARELNIDAAFVMLTAVDTIEERVNGLELGAADYVGKGVAVREVVMRCDAQARNVSRNRATFPQQITLGHSGAPPAQRVAILPTVRLAAREDVLPTLDSKQKRQPYTLEPTAFAILMHLVGRQGQVVPIVELEERFFFKTEHVRQGVRNAISKIRRCIDGAAEETFLHTHIARTRDELPGYTIVTAAVSKTGNSAS
ncbi:MAG TPA: response regulator [Sphingorhabdus sp.]|nr:response regulator [Sphingorhabdus sp.]